VKVSWHQCTLNSGAGLLGTSVPPDSPDSTQQLLQLQGVSQGEVAGCTASRTCASQVLLLAGQVLVAEVGVLLTEEIFAIPPPSGELPLELLGLVAAAAAAAAVTTKQS